MSKKGGKHMRWTEKPTSKAEVAAGGAVVFVVTLLASHALAHESVARLCLAWTVATCYRLSLVQRMLQKHHEQTSCHSEDEVEQRVGDVSPRQ